jgi:hypothetical protein
MRNVHTGSFAAGKGNPVEPSVTIHSNVINISDAETDAPASVIIPLMVTGNRVTLKTNPCGIPVS